MKKRFKFLTAVVVAVTMLTGCSITIQQGGGNVTAQPSGDNAAAQPSGDSAAAQPAGDNVNVRIGSLKGPTSIGIIKLIHDQENYNYTFTMETQPDVLLASIVSGDLDIALIPANVASVLYNKTKGGISVIDINTLGVLYMVSGDNSIKEMKDLEGRTIYTTGAGQTPEYVLKYLLSENGLDDKVNIEFKSEATEVAALLAQDTSAVGMLPQPFVTAALAQNSDLSIVLDMTEQWNALDNGSRLVTGVTIVRNDFLSEHPDEVSAFISDHASSVEYIMTDNDTAAEYVAEAGIIEKAPVAAKAIPYCNIVCITGADMKAALSGYLNVLYDRDPASVGGNLPADDFYAEVK